ncbi:F-box protein At3g07870-like isoform X1 [Papaver somniferum]|uniref:F-box protein At3g07870-like isoform X1 n=1 Tax=Papaver somniferum TaxID=3469 RepID=UPI000E705607|nr:F-box protein At3g07870-like isoform X1 [Papaver somniferum]
MPTHIYVNIHKQAAECRLPRIHTTPFIQETDRKQETHNFLSNKSVRYIKECLSGFGARRKEMADYNPINSLPTEITLSIFSRLPGESVLDCKLVCRAWRNFLQFHVNTPYFVYQHLQRQRGYVPHGLVQQQQQQHKPSDSETMSFVAFDRHTQVFWYLEYHDNGDRISDKRTNNYRIKTINMKFPADRCVKRIQGLVGSDNGLICLSLKLPPEYSVIPAYQNKVAHSPNETLCICNPITREFVTLPGILIDKKRSVDDGVHIVHGFGYHPLTNEYKVVRICYVGDRKSKSPSYRGQAEVYTIGSGCGWISVAETNLRPRYIGDPTGVCVNGALHWICDDSANIMVFDLATEKFHFLSAPTEQIHDARRIYVMRGCLCYVCYDPTDKLLRLYFLKKYYKSWSWKREFTIPLEMLHHIRFFMFSITKMGEILLINNGRDQVLGYPSQRTEISQKGFKLDATTDLRVPLPYIKTFVSLEALGETNVKKIALERSMCKDKQESFDVDRPVSPAGLLRQTKKPRKSKDTD